MLDPFRLKALQRMVKTYKPHLELDFLLSELSFMSLTPDSTSTDQEIGKEFLCRVGGVLAIVEGVEVLDTKLSNISGATVVAQDDKLLL
jgi:hypothetical protein